MKELKTWLGTTISILVGSSYFHSVITQKVNRCWGKNVFQESNLIIEIA